MFLGRQDELANFELNENKNCRRQILLFQNEDEEKWGGEVELSNGERWWIEPNPKKLPKEEVCKKLND